MIYYKYEDEYSHIAGGITYVETNEGVAYRQITVNGERYLMSNINYPKMGLMLAEGRIEYALINEAQEIYQKEFENIWNSHLTHYHVQWEKTKQKYTIGMEVTGYIQIFYPQGVIINLDEGCLAVADFAKCKASAKPEWMYPGYRVSAIVANYDELNYWLMVERPRVYGVLLKDYRVSP